MQKRFTVYKIGPTSPLLLAKDIEPVNRRELDGFDNHSEENLRSLDTGVLLDRSGNLFAAVGFGEVCLGRTAGVVLDAEISPDFDKYINALILERIEEMTTNFNSELY
jgi:hypothetical protein